MDPRDKTLADLLVNYSCEIQQGATARALQQLGGYLVQCQL